jgi:hypothetical protein
VDARTEEGKQLLERYGLDTVPAFILDGRFAHTARYPRFARAVARVADAYVPGPALRPVRQLLDRRAGGKRIDLFLDPESGASMRLAGLLMTWADREGLQDRLNVHYPLGPRDGQEARWHVCVRKADPSSLLPFLSCRVHGTVGGRRDLTLEACLDGLRLDRKRVAACAEGTEADRLLRADRSLPTEFGLDRWGASPVVLDGRFVVSARMADRVPELYQRLHPVSVADRDSVRSPPPEAGARP